MIKIIKVHKCDSILLDWIEARIESVWKTLAVVRILPNAGICETIVMLEHTPLEGFPFVSVRFRSSSSIVEEWQVVAELSAPISWHAVFGHVLNEVARVESFKVLSTEYLIDDDSISSINFEKYAKGEKFLPAGQKSNFEVDIKSQFPAYALPGDGGFQIEKSPEGLGFCFSIFGNNRLSKATEFERAVWELAGWPPPPEGFPAHRKWSENLTDWLSGVERHSGIKVATPSLMVLAASERAPQAYSVLGATADFSTLHRLFEASWETGSNDIFRGENQSPSTSVENSKPLDRRREAFRCLLINGISKRKDPSLLPLLIEVIRRGGGIESVEALIGIDGLDDESLLANLKDLISTENPIVYPFILERAEKASSDFVGKLMEIMANSNDASAQLCFRVLCEVGDKSIGGLLFEKAKYFRREKEWLLPEEFIRYIQGLLGSTLVKDHCELDSEWFEFLLDYADDSPEERGRLWQCFNRFRYVFNDSEERLQRLVGAGFSALVITAILDITFVPYGGRGLRESWAENFITRDSELVDAIVEIAIASRRKGNSRDIIFSSAAKILLERIETCEAKKRDEIVDGLNHMVCQSNSIHELFTSEELKKLKLLLPSDCFEG